MTILLYVACAIGVPMAGFVAFVVLDRIFNPPDDRHE